MAKLSSPQTRALEYVWAYGNELDPTVKPNTWASLVSKGLITRGQVVAVTPEGETAYTNTMGRDLPPRYRGNATQAEVIAPLVQQAADSVATVVPAVDQATQAMDDLAEATTLEDLFIVENRADRRAKDRKRAVENRRVMRLRRQRPRRRFVSMAARVRKLERKVAPLLGALTPSDPVTA